MSLQTEKEIQMFVNASCCHICRKTGEKQTRDRRHYVDAKFRRNLLSVSHNVSWCERQFITQKFCTEIEGKIKNFTI